MKFKAKKNYDNKIIWYESDIKGIEGDIRYDDIPKYIILKKNKDFFCKDNMMCKYGCFVLQSDERNCDLYYNPYILKTGDIYRHYKMILDFDTLKECKACIQEYENGDFDYMSIHIYK